MFVTLFPSPSQRRLDANTSVSIKDGDGGEILLFEESDKAIAWLIDKTELSGLCSLCEHMNKETRWGMTICNKSISAIVAGSLRYTGVWGHSNRLVTSAIIASSLGQQGDVIAVL